MTMTDQTRTAIILAAAQSAGPVGNDQAAWDARVRAQALTITEMLSPTSTVARAVDGFWRAGKPFPGTILGGRIEPTSTRLVVQFRNRDGQTEAIRTDRTDTPEGRSMADLVRTLKGHRVLIWKEMEANGEGANAKRFRVLRHIKDLGPA
jgi:hypothetical protein